MKLKKKAKRILIAIIIVLLIIISLVIIYKGFFNKQEVKETKIVHTIDEYGYKLKDSKSKKYKELYYELEKILKKESVDEEEYVKKITEMFIYDFYTLNDKAAKTDVGGTDFVYEGALDNFIENAEDTFYKYVESDIYNQREQALPTVDTITIDSVEQTAFAYLEQTDEAAFKVKVSWDYTEDGYSDYQKEATLTFIHEGKKLFLVELK